MHDISTPLPPFPLLIPASHVSDLSPLCVWPVKVMQDHQQQGVPLPAGASEQMDYIRVVERRRMEAATLHQQQLQQQQLQQQHMRAGAAAAGGVGTGPITASFRDVVESFAEANGVMFLPKPGRQHEGKQASVFAVNCFCCCCYFYGKTYNNGALL